METKIKKAEKKFDAVKMMRELRDKMSHEIMDMNYEQERAYLDKLLLEGNARQKLVADK